MERDVWHKRFTKKLQQEHEAQSAFDCLLRHHCDRAVVEDLLFAIAVQDKLTSQQIFRLENDFNVTSYILGEALQMLAKDLAMQRSQYVPFGPLLVRIVKLEKELMSVGCWRSFHAASPTGVKCSSAGSLCCQPTSQKLPEKSFTSNLEHLSVVLNYFLRQKQPASIMCEWRSTGSGNITRHSGGLFNGS